MSKKKKKEKKRRVRNPLSTKPKRGHTLLFYFYVCAELNTDTHALVIWVHCEFFVLLLARWKSPLQLSIKCDPC